MNKGRFEAFSDGVFAFAITLLILGVALPVLKTPVSERALRDALLGLWPNVLAYALSFAVLGIMWQNHHALFANVTRVDRRTIFCNVADRNLSDDAYVDVLLRSRADVLLDRI